MKSALIISVVAFAIAWGQPRAGSLVNFSHLNHLVQKIPFEGQQVSIVHIYADYPKYAWTDAGDEGIACVDDVARAAGVYLKDYEIRRDTSSLFRARSLLKFVMLMQASDGQFYNFIRNDYSINREGRTSVKSFGWWAGRAIWALSLGCRVTKEVDTAFSKELQQRVRRSLPNVGLVLKNYGKMETMNGFRIPKWLLYESGADATTELMLGLIEFYRSTNDLQVAGYIRQLADGLMTMQDGNASTFPYGAHRSWRTIWHSWGNSQSYVLAYAGAILHDTTMIASAEREARWFYSRLLIEGMLKEWDFSIPTKKMEYEQIAYDIRPMALGLLRLYDVTHNDVYLKMAGLSASWLLGNNGLHAVMYDSSTGRCFDGLTDSTHLNRNSGAESTIEALSTLLEIERYPSAMKYLHYKRSAFTATKEKLTGKFQNSSGDQLTLTLEFKSGSVYSNDNGEKQ
jgi:hypothetical protein